MSIISLPSGLKVERQSIGVRRYDVPFSSAYTGAVQSRPLGPQRWAMALVAPAWLTRAESAVWVSLILQLRGQLNQLAVGDLKNTAPAGTMRGTMTLDGSHAIGATTINIAAGGGQAGTTLLAGDWLQVDTGSSRELVRLVANATADGSGDIACTVEPPLRLAHSGATSVTWDTPTGLFRMAAQPGDWTVQRALETGFVLELVESWET